MSSTATPPNVAPRPFNFFRDLRVRLLALILVIAGSFVVTSFLSAAYHRKEQDLAQYWFAQGQTALENGHANNAVRYFRNALVYSTDNQLYRLRLAEGLIAANRLHEARAHLLSLGEQEPGDSLVNLQLARLAVREANIGAAQRYFHNAIYGVWPDNPVLRRIQTRFELSEFLLQQRQTSRAEVELLTLAALLPPDQPAYHVQLANLFLSAGDPRNALQEFETALKSDANLQPALTGAGMVAFQLEEYRNAERFLEHAVQQNPHAVQLADLRQTTRLVLQLDPFTRGLSSPERARRAIRDFKITLSRLQLCAAAVNNPAASSNPQRAEVASPASPATPASNSATVVLAEGKRKQRQIREGEIRKNSELLDSTMEWVFTAQQTASSYCGTPSPEDTALLLLAKHHAGAQ